MHIVRNAEPAPTAAEKLAAEIVELREDVDGLMDRLYRRPQRSPEQQTKARARRWKRVLAMVEAAVAAAAGEKRS